MVRPRNKPQNCRLCHSQEIKKIYSGPIRSGLYGKITENTYSVYLCDECGVGFLNPIPKISYEKKKYRNDFSGSADIDTYFKLHDLQQSRYLNILGVDRLRNKVICDIGCGGGSFLDYVKGPAAKTVGIEPFTGYHASLKKRGHQVFPDVDSAINFFGKNIIDLAVSFNVIEHVADPINFLVKIKAALKAGGRALIVAPSLDDILLKMAFREYEKFYYRTAHPWYFSKRSLAYILRKINITNFNIGYQHNYDLSNFVLWLKAGRPAGNSRLNNFDKSINSAWKVYLEDKGYADTIFIDFFNNA